MNSADRIKVKFIAVNHEDASVILMLNLKMNSGLVKVLYFKCFLNVIYLANAGYIRVIFLSASSNINFCNCTTSVWLIMKVEVYFKCIFRVFPSHSWSHALHNVRHCQ